MGSLAPISTAFLDGKSQHFVYMFHVYIFHHDPQIFG